MALEPAEEARLKEILYNPNTDILLKHANLLEQIGKERAADKDIPSLFTRSGIIFRAKKGWPYVASTLAALLLVFTSLVTDFPGKLGIDVFHNIQRNYAFRLLEDWPKGNGPADRSKDYKSYASRTDHYALALQQFLIDRWDATEFISKFNEVVSGALSKPDHPLTSLSNTLGNSVDRAARKFVGALFRDSFTIGYLRQQRSRGVAILNPHVNERLKTTAPAGTEGQPPHLTSVGQNVVMYVSLRKLTRIKENKPAITVVPRFRIELVSSMNSSIVKIDEPIMNQIRNERQFMPIRLNQAIKDHIQTGVEGGDVDVTLRFIKVNFALEEIDEKKDGKLVPDDFADIQFDVLVIVEGPIPIAHLPHSTKAK